MSKPSMDKMRQLINKYLADMNLNPLYGAELAQLGKCIRAGDEGGAVRYLREATARTNVKTFQIDMSNHEGVPISDFTKWLNSTDANLETGESHIDELGPKQAVDLIEFIRINLQHIEGDSQ